MQEKEEKWKKEGLKGVLISFDWAMQNSHSRLKSHNHGCDAMPPTRTLSF